MKWRWAFLAPLVAACFAACGGSSKPTGSGGGGGGDGGSGGGPAATGGGGSGGASLSKPEAGIPGCAQKFIDADGVCRPVIEKCPAGTIPKFDTGCIPVGIAACDGSFLEADGICHPSIGKCPDGTFAVPSEGCVSIDGDGCGTDAFGLASDQAGDQFVDPSNASGTPDGSRANPWPSIAEGLAHVAAGGRVRLAAGAYAEPLVPASAVAVIGRCASMVTLSGTVGSGEAAAIVLIEDVSGDVSLQGMTLSGDGYGVVVVGGTVDLDGVVVDGAMTAGIEVGHGGTGTFHHVLVRGTRPAPDQTLGTGLDAFGGGTATVEQSAVVGAYTWGIDAVDVGSRVTVSDSLVEGIQVQASDDAAGYGVIASYGGAAKVDDVAVVAVAGPGLATYDATSLTATHTLVDKVSGPHSHGIDLERSTTVNGGNDFFGSGLAVLGTDGTGAGVYTLAKATITASLFAHGRPNVQPTAESFFVTRGGSLILS
ncbi:MAG TPA: hypothetical protein VHB21_16055, partial [Minicystis sp.]|nr:hypothetical protein [Minicystis sp.]